MHSNFERRKLELTKIQKELEAKNLSLKRDDSDEEIAKRFQKLIQWHNKIKNKFRTNR